MEVPRGVDRRGEIHLHVRGSREAAVGRPGEIALAEVLDGQHFAVHGGNVEFHLLDQLIERLLATASVDDEGGFILVLGLGHWRKKNDG